MRVRAATPADMPRVVALMRELAEFEKLPGPDDAAARRLAADAFERRRIDVRVVQEPGGDVVAYAVVFETYSTFLAKPLLYLEDIYVTPAARRQGVARTLMRALAEEALRRGCARMAWAVLDWNEPAQAFYDALGARPTEWLTYQIEGEALAGLARGT